MLNSVNFKFVMHQYVTVVSCVSVNKMFVLEKEETENVFNFIFFFAMRRLSEKIL